MCSSLRASLPKFCIYITCRMDGLLILLNRSHADMNVSSVKLALGQAGFHRARNPQFNFLGFL